jgi:hypothetical protein
MPLFDKIILILFQILKPYRYLRIDAFRHFSDIFCRIYWAAIHTTGTINSIRRQSCESRRKNESNQELEKQCNASVLKIGALHSSFFWMLGALSRLN